MERSQRIIYPLEAERASAAEIEEKAGITAMLWGKAEGGIGPRYIIIKCLSTGAD